MFLPTGPELGRGEWIRAQKEKAFKYPLVKSLQEQSLGRGMMQPQFSKHKPVGVGNGRRWPRAAA